jgi:hypothetical protein
VTLNYKNIKEHIAGTVLYKSSSNLCKWHSCLTQVSPARPCSAVIHAQRPLLALTLGFGHPLPPAAYLRSGLSYVAPIARHEEKMLFLCLDPGTLAHQQIFGVGPQISRNRGCSEAENHQQLGRKECSNMVKQHFDDPVTRHLFSLAS